MFTSTLFGILARGPLPAPSGSEAIFMFIALAVVAIVVLSKWVLGGNHETKTESLALDTSAPSAVTEPDVTDPYRDRFHEKATREGRAAPQRNPKLSALLQKSIDGWGVDSHDAADEEFETAIAETIPVEAQERAFYVKVVGTSHRNSDRTSRTRIIGECSTFDSIFLVPEPDNEFDPNAIAVRRNETNEQIGYLDSRLAGEITRDMKKYGPRWVAFFRRKTQHSETGRTVGAVIRVIRLSDEFIAGSNAVRATQVEL